MLLNDENKVRDLSIYYGADMLPDNFGVECGYWCILLKWDVSHPRKNTAMTLNEYFEIYRFEYTERRTAAAYLKSLANNSNGRISLETLSLCFRRAQFGEGDYE